MWNFLIDVLMVLFMAASLWGLVSGKRGGLLLSALAWAAAVLVKKGGQSCRRLLFANRWGIKVAAGSFWVRYCTL